MEIRFHVMSAKWMSPRVKMKLMQRVKHLLLLCRAVSDFFQSSRSRILPHLEREVRPDPEPDFQID